MTPNYINSAPSPYPFELKQDQHHQPFIPTPQASSSSSLSCHIFFSSNQDQSGYYQQPQYQQDAKNHALHGGSCDQKHESLKLSLWKREDRADHQSGDSPVPVKWMSSKMRLMQKMKSSDRMVVEARDHKQTSYPLETDSSSSNSCSNNTNTPIRVCADCNTTKTPLWRSGPKGPKSLCNACGIRQRKARRAMAAAAAAAEANGTILAAETSPIKTKVHQKEKIKHMNGHGAQHKKMCKLTAGPSHEQRKLGFEDFLLNLSKNLALHGMCPQDEKDAAILLMALSCGLVDG